MIVDVTSGCSDDDDSSPNNDLAYDIESVNGVVGNDGIFQLGASNGELEFASAPNFESATEHIVVITVSNYITNYVVINFKICKNHLTRKYML